MKICAFPVNEPEQENGGFLVIYAFSGQSASGPKFDMEKAARPERDGPPAE